MMMHSQRESGKKKAHKHKLFGPIALGTTHGVVPGQTEVFSLFYIAQVVPGTNRGRTAAEKGLC